MRPPFFVMAGLDPAIHVFLSRGTKVVDARDKPGHDELSQQADLRNRLNPEHSPIFIAVTSVVISVFCRQLR